MRPATVVTVRVDTTIFRTVLFSQSANSSVEPSSVETMP